MWRTRIPSITHSTGCTVGLCIPAFYSEEDIELFSQLSMSEKDGDGNRNRIVIGTGIDLDKRELYEVTKSIGLDRDLRKLSLLGPVLWNLFVLGLVIGTVIVFVSSLGTVGSIVDSAVRFLMSLSADQIYGLAGFVLRNGLPIAVVVYLVSILWKNLHQRLRRSFIDDLVGSVKEFPEHIVKALVVLKPDVWQNHNYWHPFKSGQSDRDPLIILSNADKDGSVSGVYSDEPYYRNVFVDSVYVTFEGLDSRRSLELRWFHRGVKRIRSLLLILLAVPSLLYVAHRWVVPISIPPFGESWTIIGSVSNALFLAIVVSTVSTRYSRFHSEFYGNSAGTEEYGTLLNRDPQKALIEDKGRHGDETLLGNSLAGYGIFYLSKFLRDVVSKDKQYTVTTEADGDADDTDGKALVAAEHILNSSIPAPTPTDDTSSEDGVIVNLHGVRQFKVGDGWEPGHIRKLQSAFSGDSNEEKRGYKTTEGEKKGIRLPVKKYVSVPSGIYGDSDLSHPDNDSDFPFFFHESWDDDTVHYLLLGGAEHQQALVKFVRYMKQEGYENIDLVENTFANKDSLKFVSEYFVSSVLGDEDKDVFRGENSFVLLHHEFEEDKHIHVLVGHSAIGTKVGFLYWLEQLYPEFEQLSEDEEFRQDVLYNINYEAEGSFEFLNYDAEDSFEVGNYYLNDSWMDDDENRGLEFEWLGQTDDLDSSQDVEKSDDKVGCRNVKISVREKPTKQKYSEGKQ